MNIIRNTNSAASPPSLSDRANLFFPSLAQTSLALLLAGVPSPFLLSSNAQNWVVNGSFESVDPVLTYDGYTQGVCIKGSGEFWATVCHKSKGLGQIVCAHGRLEVGKPEGTGVGLLLPPMRIQTDG